MQRISSYVLGTFPARGDGSLSPNQAFRVVVMVILGWQPDYIWNQLKPKISGPQLRDFLNLVIAVGRPTLNLGHSGGIPIEDWRKEGFVPACPHS